jgi:signal transduction histidine kinase
VSSELGAAKPARPVRERRGRLVRKYAVIFVFLISGGLLTSGLIEFYISYQQSQVALARVEREKAVAAAATIEQFVADIQRQMGWVIQPAWTASSVDLEQRRSDYLQLLRHVRAVTQVNYFDALGREQVKVSRLDKNVIGSQVDFSQDPKFQEAQLKRLYFSPVYFRDESEPYMSIAMSESGVQPGVTAVEVNLKFIWDAVSQIKVGEDGYAYVVDADGQLIAHPDISLVLQRADFSSLSQVQVARGGSATDEGRPSTIVARDLDGRQVLSAYEPIAPLGWTVFVEQPLDEALAPVYASVVLTAVLLLIGLAVSVLTSLLLARKMIEPIRALQAGAVRIGGGALDQRIEVHTGDELEALAEEFNRMAAHLQESYAHLEHRVQVRTHDLAEALDRGARLYRELEEKSRQLEEVSRHKSEFLASMSHELRTPMNAIIGFSEVLLEQMFGELNEQQEEYLRDILTSGQHLLSLINDILDLSKVEAGRMELEIGPFSLRQALENGLTMLRERAGRHGITLSLEVDPGVDQIEADERKVKQVVFNLLSNAVKFTPDGGHVQVTAIAADGDVRVAVRDTGVGIAPDEQAHVFEEFHQTGAGRAQSEGTGLGLPLAKRFVELHGGQMWVESQVGVGSTFTFSLPLQVGANAVEALN